MLSMIETVSFILGFGFSVLVYVRSIRTADLSWRKKAGYAFFTFIGITGTVFLAGVLIADRLRTLSISSF
jgi:multidrug transporter EmrE-like cation transporter